MRGSPGDHVCTQTISEKLWLPVALKVSVSPNWLHVIIISGQFMLSNVSLDKTIGFINRSVELTIKSSLFFSHLSHLTTAVMSFIFQSCQNSCECLGYPSSVLAQPYLSGLILTHKQSTISKTGFSHLVCGWHYLLSIVSAVSNEKGPGKLLGLP